MMIVNKTIQLLKEIKDIFILIFGVMSTSNWIKASNIIIMIVINPF